MPDKFTFHSHNTFCDGKNTPEEMVIAAIEKGLTHFGFSSHAPVPFENTFAVKQEQLQTYLDECRRLKEKYKNKIKLAIGLEYDYITDLIEDINQRAAAANLDYFIGCVHLVKLKGDNRMWFIDGGKQETYDNELQTIFGGDIRKAVGAFFSQTNAMISKCRPNIIGHLDKIKMHNHNRFFSEDERWYEDLMMSTLELISKTGGIIIEVNCRGLYKHRCEDLFPSRKWLQRIAQMRIPITISTDCHNVSEIDSLFCETREAVKTLGFSEVMIYDEGWKPCRI
ncbi:MAG: histidinol-phosphatase [Bacteroidales bacterium]|jgi:histidinol-phosphatase (PHP family)|nr:histidinol-phosphatase [Bacteroidales bacterium]